MSESELNPASESDDGWITGLRRLNPIPVNGLRDRTVFATGRAEGRRSMIIWRLTTGLFARTTLGSLGWIITDHHPITEPTMIFVPVPVVMPSPAPTTPIEVTSLPENEPETPLVSNDISNETAEWLRRRRDVLLYGVEMLNRPVAPTIGVIGPATIADSPRWSVWGTHPGERSLPVIDDPLN